MYRKLPFYLILFVSLITFAQHSDTYRGFGSIPEEVPMGLHKDLSQAKTPEEKLAYLDTISTFYLRADTADSIAFYGQKMREEIKRIPSPSLYHLKSYYVLGVGKQQQGLLDAAILSFLEGLSIKDTSKRMRSRILLSLAETYLLKNETKKSKVILDSIALDSKDVELHAKLSMIQGDYDYDISAFAKAKKHYAKALALLENTSQKKETLELQYRLAKVALKEGNIDKALALFKTIRTEALPEGFYDLYIKTMIYEGRIYTFQENYSVAEAILSTAFANSMQWNRSELRKDVILATSDLYAKKEDYQNAYSLMTQYAYLNNEIAQNQNSMAVRDFEVRYETLEKEKKITTLESEQLLKQAEITKQKTIKNAFLIGFLVILIPIVSFLIVYYQKLQAQSKLNEQQEILNQQEVRALMQSQELEIARASMKVQYEERHRIARELHDSIGGNLGAIKLQMKQDGNEIDQLLIEQIDQTYEQVREISHSLIPKEFSKLAFTDLIHQYIETFGNGQSFKIAFIFFGESHINNLPERLKVSIFNIIKELLTNAHKHAQATQIDLQLNYYKEEDSLSLIYEDNGTGFDVEAAKKGIGLKNLNHRIKENKGTLTIDSAPSRGTVISITLPNIQTDEK